MTSYLPHTIRAFFTRALPGLNDLFAPIDDRIERTQNEFLTTGGNAASENTQRITDNNFPTTVEELPNAVVEKTKKNKKGNSRKRSSPASDIQNQADSKKEEYFCCICFEEPISSQLASIDSCSHKFCFKCIKKWSSRKNICPLCKAHFSTISVVNKALNHKKRRRVNAKELGFYRELYVDNH